MERRWVAGYVFFSGKVRAFREQVVARGYGRGGELVAAWNPSATSRVFASGLGNTSICMFAVACLAARDRL